MKFKMTAAILALTVLFAGTGIQAEETQPAAEENIVQIGEKTADSDYTVILRNGTGKEITGVALRVNYEDFSDNLLADDVTLPDGGQGSFSCAPAQMANYVPPVYDLQLTFADDKTAVLHTLPLGDADEIEILLDTEAGEAAAEDETEAEAAEADGVAYIKFTSLSLQYETDTKGRENEIAQIGEQVLIADYQAKVAGASSAGSSGGDGGAGNGGGASSGGGQQQCLDNGLFF